LSTTHSGDVFLTGLEDVKAADFSLRFGETNQLISPVRHLNPSIFDGGAGTTFGAPAIVTNTRPATVSDVVGSSVLSISHFCVGLLSSGLARVNL
jgi:hypothetical protein